MKMLKAEQRLEDMVKIAIPVGGSSEAAHNSHGISRRALLSGIASYAAAHAVRARPSEASEHRRRQSSAEYIRSRAQAPNFDAIKDEFAQAIVQGVYGSVFRNGTDLGAAYGKLKKLGYSYSTVDQLLNDRPMMANRHLIPRGFFLSWMKYPPDVIKVFPIMETRDFNGFVDESGNWRSDIFGYKFGTFRQLYLDNEVFSSHRIPPEIPYSRIEGIGNLVGIPIRDIQKIYPGKPKLVEAETEALTMHEITHAIFNTPFEEIAFMGGNGYKSGAGRKIQTEEDILNDLRRINLTKSEYGRIQLFRILKGIATWDLHNNAYDGLREKLNVTTARLYSMDATICPSDPGEISDQQKHRTMRMHFHKSGIASQYRYV